MQTTDAPTTDTPPDERVPAGKAKTAGSGQKKQEDRVDRVTAWISILYLILTVLGFFWLLFDTWIGQHSIPNLLGYKIGLLENPAFRQVTYTLIGGALGGAINGIRSFLTWYSEKNVFGKRYLWKYISLPWLGATLALFAYSLILGGVVTFTGDVTPTAEGLSLTQSLVAFAIGGLAGYGSRDVMMWLDAQVTRLFKAPPPTTKVPNLFGLTREQAEIALKNSGLTLGTVTEETREDALPGKVVNQVPAFDATVEPNQRVDITLAVKPEE